MSNPNSPSQYRELPHKEATKLCHTLLERFFPSRVQRTYDSEESTYNLKRPFPFEDAEKVNVEVLTDLFGGENLYVLRHHTIDGNNTVVLEAPSHTIAEALSDVDGEELWKFAQVLEWATIFDANFTTCFWVHDSTIPVETPTGTHYRAVLFMHNPVHA